ncbi:hypothetical protein ANN_11058 [Periplaneta americana]|uniref:Uncharacterized protein n=1 Tax=Periplaneta americana TaxID=6978 RepID=A0ABQ8T3X9_PERAM|nr:hypothetical protein ANN_11058 [Periplaneta americana]
MSMRILLYQFCSLNLETYFRTRVLVGEQYRYDAYLCVNEFLNCTKFLDEIFFEFLTVEDIMLSSRSTIQTVDTIHERIDTIQQSVEKDMERDYVIEINVPQTSWDNSKELTGKLIPTKSNWLFNDAVSTTRLFSVDEIGDSEMVFGEMRLRIRRRLPGIHLTVGKTSDKTQSALRLLIPRFFNLLITVYEEPGKLDAALISLAVRKGSCRIASNKRASSSNEEIRERPGIGRFSTSPDFGNDEPTSRLYFQEHRPNGQQI